MFSDETFTKVYLSEYKQQMPANMSLNDFCNDVGITENLKSDRTPEFSGKNSEFLKYFKQKGIELSYAEPERKNQISPIDVEIREPRKRTHKKMKATNTPRRLWDNCLVHQANIRQCLPRDNM